MTNSWQPPAGSREALLAWLQTSSDEAAPDRYSEWVLTPGSDTVPEGLTERERKLYDVMEREYADRHRDRLRANGGHAEAKRRLSDALSAGRPFVLFLRPFRVEAESRSAGEIVPEMRGGSHEGSQLHFVKIHREIEELICGHSPAGVPIVCIANPGVPVMTQLSAIRVGDADWTFVVRMLVAAAAAIVVVHEGKTDGIATEIAIIEQLSREASTAAIASDLESPSVAVDPRPKRYASSAQLARFTERVALAATASELVGAEPVRLRAFLHECSERASSEPLDTAEALAASEDPTHPAASYRLEELCKLARSHLDAGRLAEGLEVARAGLKTFADGGPERYRAAAASLKLAAHHGLRELERYDEAAAALTDAFTLIGEPETPQGHGALGELFRALAHWQLILKRDAKEAVNSLAMSSTSFERAGRHSDGLHVLSLCAWTLLHDGRREEAGEVYTIVVRRCQEEGALGLHADVMRDLSDFVWQGGEWRATVMALALVVHLRSEAQDWNAFAQAVRQLAARLVELAADDSALLIYDWALVELKRNGQTKSAIVVGAQRGMLLFGMGAFERAMESLAECLAFALDADNPEIAYVLILLLYGVKWIERDPRRARASLERAWDLAISRRECEPRPLLGLFYGLALHAEGLKPGPAWRAGFKYFRSSPQELASAVKLLNEHASDALVASALQRAFDDMFLDLLPELDQDTQGHRFAARALLRHGDEHRDQAFQALRKHLEEMRSRFPAQHPARWGATRTLVEMLAAYGLSQESDELAGQLGSGQELLAMRKQLDELVREFIAASESPERWRSFGSGVLGSVLGRA